MPVGDYKDMSPAAQRRRHPGWVRQNMWRSMVKVPGTKTPGKPRSGISLLSTPEKMPGPSWSLPAGPACPFAVYGEGTVCGVCYANPKRERLTQGNAYGRWSSTMVAQHARFEWTRRCMKTAEGRSEFMRTLAGAILSTGAAYMRVHDSGDLFSPAYTRCWIGICRALPEIRFWFPTRSWQAPWVDVIRELAALPNVSVRPSALMIGDAPPVVAGLAAGTTVIEVGYTCPAPHQGGYCGDCRRCWVRKSMPVSYHAH